MLVVKVVMLNKFESKAVRLKALIALMNPQLTSKLKSTHILPRCLCADAPCCLFFYLSELKKKKSNCLSDFLKRKNNKTATLSDTLSDTASQDRAYCTYCTQPHQLCVGLQVCEHADTHTAWHVTEPCRAPPRCELSSHSRRPHSLPPAESVAGNTTDNDMYTWWMTK